nr:hypothetical protein PAR2.2 homolog - Caenorhabditis elegans [Caenorhabditis elegans]
MDTSQKFDIPPGVPTCLVPFDKVWEEQFWATVSYYELNTRVGEQSHSNMCTFKQYGSLFLYFLKKTGLLYFLKVHTLKLRSHVLGQKIVTETIRSPNKFRVKNHNFVHCVSIFMKLWEFMLSTMI